MVIHQTLQFAVETMTLKFFHPDLDRMKTEPGLPEQNIVKLSVHCVISALSAVKNITAKDTKLEQSPQRILKR